MMDRGSATQQQSLAKRSAGWVFISNMGSTLEQLKSIFKSLLGGTLPNFVSTHVLTMLGVGETGNESPRKGRPKKIDPAEAELEDDGSKERAMGRSIVIFNDYSAGMRDSIHNMRRQVERSIRLRNARTGPVMDPKGPWVKPCTLIIGRKGVGKASLVNALFARKLAKETASSEGLSLRQCLGDEFAAMVWVATIPEEAQEGAVGQTDGNAFRRKVVTMREELRGNGAPLDIVLYVIDATSEFCVAEARTLLDVFGGKLIFVVNKVDLVKDERLNSVYESIHELNGAQGSSVPGNAEVRISDDCNLFRTIADVRKMINVLQCPHCGSDELVIRNAAKMAHCAACSWENSIAFSPEQFGTCLIAERIHSLLPPEKAKAWAVAQQVSHVLKDAAVRKVISDAWNEAQSASSSMSTSVSISVSTSASSMPSMSGHFPTVYSRAEVVKGIVAQVVSELGELFGLDSAGVLARSNDSFWEGSAAGKLINLIVQLLQEEEDEFQQQLHQQQGQQYRPRGNRIVNAEVFIAAFSFVLHDVMKRMTMCPATRKSVEKDVALQERMKALQLRGLTSVLDSMLIPK